MASQKELMVSAMMVLKAVAEAIRDAKGMPSGTLYAALSSKGCSLDQYEKIIGMMERSGLIRRDGNHYLTWIAE